MSRRMWAFALAAWVVVVIAGSGLTWIAIERAGDQVSATPESAETTQPPVLGTVGPAPSTTPPVTPTAPASPHPSSSTTARPSTTVTAAPTAPSHPSTSPRPATASPKPSSQPAPRTVVRTWSEAPGSLTVSCTGGQVSFRSATPSNGWSLERGDSSGEDVEVTFKSGGSEVQVRATCSGGVPQFGVESGGDRE